MAAEETGPRAWLASGTGLHAAVRIEQACRGNRARVVLCQRPRERRERARDDLAIGIEQPHERSAGQLRRLIDGGAEPSVPFVSDERDPGHPFDQTIASVARGVVHDDDL
jgi:hypothetical protein